MRNTIVGLALALVICPIAGKAETYPSRPIRFLSPYPAGNGGDLSNRFVLDLVSKRLNQPIVIENRPGPNGVVAAVATKSADPDGYTLTAIGNVHAIGQSLMQSPPYDVVNDFIPISILGFSDVVIITAPNSPLNTVADVVKKARSGPDKFATGTAVAGTTQFLTATLFNSKADLSSPIVPFRTSGDLMTAVTRGDVSVAFELLPAVLPLITSGTLKAIAVSSSKRFPELPNVPTFRESGDFPSVTGWQIISAPRSTPLPIVKRINAEISKVLSDKDVRAKYQKMGYTPAGGTLEYTHGFLQEEIVKWKEAIEKSKIPHQ